MPESVSRRSPPWPWDGSYFRGSGARPAASRCPGPCGRWTSSCGFRGHGRPLPRARHLRRPSGGARRAHVPDRHARRGRARPRAPPIARRSSTGSCSRTSAARPTRRGSPPSTAPTTTSPSAMPRGSTRPAWPRRSVYIVRNSGGFRDLVRVLAAGAKTMRAGDRDALRAGRGDRAHARAPRGDGTDDLQHSTSTGTARAIRTAWRARRSRCSRASPASRRRPRSSSASSGSPRARDGARAQRTLVRSRARPDACARSGRRPASGASLESERAGARVAALEPEDRVRHRRRGAARPRRRGVRPGDRREVAVHRPPLGAASPRSPSRSAGARSGSRRVAARPAPRGPAARHRQARGLEPDPRQAGEADRRRVRGGPAPSRRHRADPAARPASPTSPHVGRGHHEKLDGSRLPPRPPRRRARRCPRASWPSPTSSRR